LLIHNGNYRPAVKNTEIMEEKKRSMGMDNVFTSLSMSPVPGEEWMFPCVDSVRGNEWFANGPSELAILQSQSLVIHKVLK